MLRTKLFFTIPPKKRQAGGTITNRYMNNYLLWRLAQGVYFLRNIANNKILVLLFILGWTRCFDIEILLEPAYALKNPVNFKSNHNFYTTEDQDIDRRTIFLVFNLKTHYAHQRCSHQLLNQ